MTSRELYREFGNIDPKMIEAAAPAEKVQSAPKKGMRQKKKNGWIKWTSVAACLLLILSAVLALSFLHKDESGVVVDPNKDRYKDFTIQSGELGMVWPWEYMTIYEKYIYLDVDGEKYTGCKREISVSYIGKKVGSYEATGYDNTVDNGIYHEIFDAYVIKGVASDRLLAVKMNGQYYVFRSKKYDPPSAFGGVLEAYSFSNYVELERFSSEENNKEKSYHLLNNDDYVWDVLKSCSAAKASEPTLEWHENKGDFISFTVTSEGLGVYKKAMYITESGYIWTNAFEGEYLYFIGEDAAGKIIKYAKDNSTEAEYEPYNKTIAGEIVEITDSYILVDDSVLCKDPADGIAYKIMINDIRISRFVDTNAVSVGSTVIVAYDGEIDNKNGNAINNAISISEGIIHEGAILIPE